MNEFSIPESGLVVLIGVSGSGKSTFAAKHFGRFETLSSDYFRGLVGNDETDQSVTAAAFDALHYVAGKRLEAGLLTVVDATSVQPAARQSLIELARSHDVLATAIVLDVPVEVCLERNETRGERRVPKSAIDRQHQQLRRSLKMLRREGFAFAADVAWLLVIATVPPAMLALSALMQWFVWMPPNACGWLEFDFLACRGEELVVELGTLAAALAVFRLVRFAPIAAVIAGLGVRLLFHAADALGASTVGYHTQGWIWCAGACLSLAAAIHAERSQPRDLDVARWLHLVALICAVPGTLQLVGSESVYKHLLPFVAFVAFALALLLRRLAWLVFGMGCAAGYVVWLAGTEFRDSPAFPIVLAALGIAMIVATVWMQRNADRLAARFGVAARGGRPHFPGGPWLFLLPVGLAFAMVPLAQREDAAQRAEYQWSADRQARRARKPPSAPGRTEGQQPPPGGASRPSGGRPVPQET